MEAGYWDLEGGDINDVCETGNIGYIDDINSLSDLSETDIELEGSIKSGDSTLSLKKIKRAKIVSDDDDDDDDDDNDDNDSDSDEDEDDDNDSDSDEDEDDDNDSDSDSDEDEDEDEGISASESSKDMRVFDPLRTYSKKQKFGQACELYGFSHDFERMAHYIRTSTRRPELSFQISSISVARRFEEFNDASRLVGKLQTRRPKGKQAKEVSEEELREEEEKADQALLLEAREALNDTGPPKSSLASTVFSFGDLKKLGQKIMQSADASMTKASFELLVYLTITWLRRVIDDAMVFDEELRARMIKTPITPFVFLQSVKTAIQINGINLDQVEEDNNNNNPTNDGSTLSSSTY